MFWLINKKNNLWYTLLSVGLDHYKTGVVMMNIDTKGGIALSHPQTNKKKYGLYFLLTIELRILLQGTFLCSLNGRFNENSESKCIHHAYICKD